MERRCFFAGFLRGSGGYYIVQKKVRLTTGVRLKRIPVEQISRSSVWWLLPLKTNMLSQTSMVGLEDVSPIEIVNF